MFGRKNTNVCAPNVENRAYGSDIDLFVIWEMSVLEWHLRRMLRIFVLAASVIYGNCSDVSEIAFVWSVVCGSHPHPGHLFVEFWLLYLASAKIENQIKNPGTLKFFLFWDFDGPTLLRLKW